MMSTKTLESFTPQIVQAAQEFGWPTKDGVMVQAESSLHLTVWIDGKQVGMGQLQQGGLMLILKPNGYIVKGVK